MYRHRIHMTVRDVQGWNEAVAVVHGLNDMATRLNQPRATLWTETFGVFNQLVAEVDYSSLAEFETSQGAMTADPEWFELLGRLNPVLVEGEGYTELLEEATAVGGPEGSTDSA